MFVCPQCKGANIRPSLLRGPGDYVRSLIQIYPYRCRDCRRRFHRWAFDPRTMLYASCKRCGTPVLHRVPRRKVTESTFLRALTLIFGFRAYRCERCRNNFFAIRPMFRHAG